MLMDGLDAISAAYEAGYASASTTVSANPQCAM